RAQERQPVAVGQETAAGWAEGEVRLARQGDAERLPVQAPVEEPEAAGVDVDEQPLVFEHGEVERQPLDLGGLDADASSGPFGALLGASVDPGRWLGSRMGGHLKHGQHLLSLGRAMTGRSGYPAVAGAPGSRAACRARARAGWRSPAGQ